VRERCFWMAASECPDSAGPIAMPMNPAGLEHDASVAADGQWSSPATLLGEEVIERA